MRVFEYMKREGANPIVKAAEPSHDDYSTLEDLFTKMLEAYSQRCATLARLTAEAAAMNDACTLEFLRQLEKVQQQDGLLLQTIMEEVHNAQLSGMGLPQTDQHLLNIVNFQQH